MGTSRFTSPQAQSDYYRAYDAGLRTLPPPAGEHDVETDYGIAKVYRFGDADGEPIALLPGRAGTPIMWRADLTGLMEHHPVYAIDPIGEAGRSTQTASIDTTQDHARWLDQTLDRLELGRVHLVGVSFGGWLAGNLAVWKSSRLASVSVLDPANTFGRFPPTLIIRSLLGMLPVISHWARPAFMRWISGSDRMPENDPVSDVIAAGLHHHRVRTAMPAYFRDEQLRSISVPMLALIAGRSVIHHPAAAHARAQRLVAGIQAELWPDATHSISAESPVEVNERVLRFIAACAPTP
ncbi:alpha/beta fold hydrolase [Kibdelosporangium phytohabitans]|uniref:Menaquinone biosynthesis protein n=1 Tax=Kibdelosporangium phytohabitans TaxID=860235 RepID=A0A0N9I155_9PSEU|nr:alpha/beta hydrolase [Kibdelosporangium phytohabitans]ALG13594.1 menaquinone biosynthesis protein [Kibdelosporangium phytohabitans]MBE1465466.1 pimeloyl-ACP methyl ester carboxylesterase [Kibdelosporangium phytohabitans]